LAAATRARKGATASQTTGRLEEGRRAAAHAAAGRLKEGFCARAGHVHRKVYFCLRVFFNPKNSQSESHHCRLCNKQKE
tara:strand:- start:1260 stop:1496 length:237 start_codon:yes stop_codon:yes gene_type:complete